MSEVSRARITFFITVKDEEANLPYALESLKGWVDDVIVLDSGSTDRTKEIALSYGTQFLYHEWIGYAGQKNWGLDHLPMKHPWIFILDADEVITPKLKEELIRIASEDTCVENAFQVNRYFVFLEKRICHSGYYPSWNVRFFRKGKARYEQRDVHERMIVDGKIGFLKHDMEHYDRRGIEYYVTKHNHYSTLEAKEIFKILTGQSHEVSASFWGSASDRRRWIKHHIWPKLPARWFFRWVYMYILRLGFLDGRVGFHFCLFLAAYEQQITLKLRELFAMEKGKRKESGEDCAH